MSRTLRLFAIGFVLCSKLFASAYDANPKLVVLLIIDQFRGDYLERWHDRFVPDGFRYKNGQKLQLVVYDDGADANAARTFATRLIEEDKVVAMVGGTTTGATMAMIPLFEEGQIPLISLAGAIQIIEPVRKWVFKTPHTDKMACEKIFADLKQRNLTTVALISGTDAFGKSMQQDFSDAIASSGGKFEHSDVMPLGTTDFSSYMLAAKNAHPQVLALLNAGADTVNSMKAAKEFGLDKQMKIAVGLLFLSDVDALPDVFAGSKITTSWYWNMDKASRAWSDRYAARMHGLRTTDIQAADYSATMQWLRAVKASGSVDADKVVAQLDGKKFSDFYARNGQWRARDHRVLHDMYVVDVLPQSEVKEPHAWFKIIETIPAEKAFRPASQSTCQKDW